MRLPLVCLALVALATACQSSNTGHIADQQLPSSNSAAYQAHVKFVKAINSNDLDRLLGMLTEDVVVMAPNTPPMVGKDAARPWMAGYFEAFETHWDKTVLEFVVNGEWAYQRYSYSHTDTPRGGGDIITGTGWGLAIYHLDDDGEWRVARDSWGSDQPPQ